MSQKGNVLSNSNDGYSMEGVKYYQNVDMVFPFIYAFVNKAT